MTIATNRRGRWRLMCVAAAATVMLAGCFGGGDDDDDQPPVAQDPLDSVPQSASQSGAGLIAYLRALTSVTSETREPVSLEGVNPPTSDNTEPEAL